MDNQSFALGIMYFRITLNYEMNVSRRLGQLAGKQNRGFSRDVTHYLHLYDRVTFCLFSDLTCKRGR